jgi:hypothetical protein
LEPYVILVATLVFLLGLIVTRSLGHMREDRSQALGIAAAQSYDACNARGRLNLVPDQVSLVPPARTPRFDTPAKHIDRQWLF